METMIAPQQNSLGGTPSENRAKPELWYPNPEAKRIGDWLNSIPVESYTGQSDEEFLGIEK